MNVSKADEYAIKARVASGSDASSFILSVDDKVASDTIKIPKGDDWDSYTTIDGGKIKLTEGEHVLRIGITGSFANIDWIKIANEKPDDKTGLVISRMDRATPQNYRVFDLQGSYLGTIFAEPHNELQQVKGLVKENGIYLVKGANGKATKVRITSCR